MESLNEIIKNQIKAPFAFVKCMWEKERDKLGSIQIGACIFTTNMNESIHMTEKSKYPSPLINLLKKRQEILQAT